MMEHNAVLLKDMWLQQLSGDGAVHGARMSCNYCECFTRVKQVEAGTEVFGSWSTLCACRPRAGNAQTCSACDAFDA